MQGRRNSLLGAARAHRNQHQAIGVATRAHGQGWNTLENSRGGEFLVHDKLRAQVELAQDKLIEGIETLARSVDRERSTLEGGIRAQEFFHLEVNPFFLDDVGTIFSEVMDGTQVFAENAHKDELHGDHEEETNDRGGHP